MQLIKQNRTLVKKLHSNTVTVSTKYARVLYANKMKATMVHDTCCELPRDSGPFGIVARSCAEVVTIRDEDWNSLCPDKAKRALKGKPPFHLCQAAK